jgi:hypothetical protein
LSSGGLANGSLIISVLCLGDRLLCAVSEYSVKSSGREAKDFGCMLIKYFDDVIGMIMYL